MELKRKFEFILKSAAPFKCPKPMDSLPVSFTRNTIQWLALLVATAGCSNHESVDLFTSIAFENFTGSEIVVHLGSKNVKIMEDSVGYLPELEDNKSPKIRVYRLVNGLWTSEVEMIIETDPNERDVIRFKLNQEGNLVVEKGYTVNNANKGVE